MQHKKEVVNKVNDLQIINEQEVLGKKFRIYGDFENPLFLAKDVANWIEHSNASKMVSDADLDETEKVTGRLSTLTNSYSALFLTEDGLYEVLMQSRKPIAKEFKKRVKEILKGLRTGKCYIVPQNYKEAIQHLLTQIEQNEQLQLENKMKDQQIRELKPKADYYDLILQSKGLVTTNAIAKDYGMSARALNTKLHELFVQYKQSGQWFLYSKYQSMGYTQSETIHITRSDGRPDVVMNTKWTQKDRLFLYQLLKENGILPILEREI